MRPKTKLHGKLVVTESELKETICNHCACVQWNLDHKCCWCKEEDLIFKDMILEDSIEVPKFFAHKLYDIERYIENEIGKLKDEREKISQTLREYQDELLD